MTNHDVVAGFLHATTGDDPGAIADWYADHVTIEMPFDTAGLTPSRIETTRDELRTRFAAGATTRRYRSLSDVHVHQTTDPEVVVLEYRLHGAMVATGSPFTLEFVMILTIRDGRIVHSRDYSNPIAGAKALGAVPRLIEALTR